MGKKKKRKLDGFAQQFFVSDMRRLGIPLNHFRGTFPRRRNDVQIVRRLELTITIQGDGWLLAEGGQMVLHDGVKDSLEMLVQSYLEYRSPDYVFSVSLKRA